jgi:hypothetical protein
VTGLRVQPSGGLVEDQHLGLVHQRPGDQQPALHPARQPQDRPVPFVLQGHEPEQLVGPGAGLAGPDAEVPGVDQEVLDHRDLLVQVVLLRHDAHPALEVAVVPRGHRPPEHRQHAVGGRSGARDHAHRGGLAGPVRSQEAEALLGGHGEVDPSNGLERAVSLDESLGGYRVHASDFPRPCLTSRR